MSVAYIGRVTQIDPIEGADRIESLEVVCGEGGRWRGTAQKGLHKVTDLVEVYLQDALLPRIERFAFMEKHDYRVKMKRFKGVPSECLIMPLKPFFDDEGGHLPFVGAIIPDVEKYEKPIPANLQGEVLGDFPTHLIPKTDEPNFQTVPHLVEALRGQPFYGTVKCDGTSVTFYEHEGHFGVCSRNLELKENKDNRLWQMAEKYNLKNMIKGLALQGELVGPGIQGNPMGLKEHCVFFFNIWVIDQRRYFNGEELLCWFYGRDLSMVPLLESVRSGSVFDYSEDELRKLAQGNYVNGKPREGIVIRPMNEMKVNGERLSFKVINLDYKG